MFNTENVRTLQQTFLDQQVLDHGLALKIVFGTAFALLQSLKSITRNKPHFVVACGSTTSFTQELTQNINPIGYQLLSIQQETNNKNGGIFVYSKTNSLRLWYGCELVFCSHRRIIPPDKKYIHLTFLPRLIIVKHDEKRLFRLVTSSSIVLRDERSITKDVTISRLFFGAALANALRHRLPMYAHIPTFSIEVGTSHTQLMGILIKKTQNNLLLAEKSSFLLCRVAEVQSEENTTDMTSAIHRTFLNNQSKLETLAGLCKAQKDGFLTRPRTDMWRLTRLGLFVTFCNTLQY